MFRPKGAFIRIITTLWVAGWLVTGSVQAQDTGSGKKKILVVSSYHPQYLWSQGTQSGVCAALLQYGLLDSPEQAATFTQTNEVESSKAILKKVWMDTKYKNTTAEIAQATADVVTTAKSFNPDLILLGDDNAANYVGNYFIDTDIPVVFWGINGSPFKYSLLDSIEEPGHNVTGVYQAGYIKESLEYLLKLVPTVKTIAALSDDSPSGRSKIKNLQALMEAEHFPVKLVSTVITNDYAQWQSQALSIAHEVDAFFMANHNTLRDTNGNVVDTMEVGAWYLRHVRKPDFAVEKFFAEEGVLLVVDDSAYKQGFEATEMAAKILLEGADPATMPVRAPERGAVIVNRERADVLGIDLSDKDFIEETLETSLALKAYPEE